MSVMTFEFVCLLIFKHLVLVRKVGVFELFLGFRSILTV